MGHNLGKRGQYGNMPKIKKKTFFFSKITKADHKLCLSYECFSNLCVFFLLKSKNSCGGHISEKNLKMLVKRHYSIFGLLEAI